MTHHPKRSRSFSLVLVALLLLPPSSADIAPGSYDPGIYTNDDFLSGVPVSAPIAQIERWLIAAEGAYHVPNPATDKGGATAWGISSASYPKLDLKSLTPAAAAQIAVADFWTPIKADQMHPIVGFALFDFAFNSGTGTAVRQFQRALGVKADGVVGPQTLAAINALDPHYAFSILMGTRIVYLAGLSNAGPNLNGWTRRCFNLTMYLLDPWMAGRWA